MNAIRTTNGALVVASLSAVLFSGALAQAPTVLRDPRLRDEDISHTSVQAVVKRLDGGVFEYRYKLTSPSSNLGEILSFKIDVTCELDFGNPTFPEPPYPFPAEDNGPPRHVPLQAYPAIGPSGANPTPRAAITRNGELSFPLGLDPGSAVEVRLLSVAPPGPRAFRLRPSMSSTDIEADGSGWDYAGAEHDETVPWIEDFQVTGVTTGPACALAPPSDSPKLSH